MKVDRDRLPEGVFIQGDELRAHGSVCNPYVHMGCVYIRPRTNSTFYVLDVLKEREMNLRDTMIRSVVRDDVLDDFFAKYGENLHETTTLYERIVLWSKQFKPSPGSRLELFRFMGQQLLRNRQEHDLLNEIRGLSKKLPFPVLVRLSIHVEALLSRKGQTPSECG